VKAGRGLFFRPRSEANGEPFRSVGDEATNIVRGSRRERKLPLQITRIPGPAYETRGRNALIQRAYWLTLSLSTTPACFSQTIAAKSLVEFFNIFFRGLRKRPGPQGLSVRKFLGAAFPETEASGGFAAAFGRFSRLICGEAVE
jgi:hypothetical protein